MSRILIVDDEDLIRKSCKLLLGKKDHQIAFASDGAQALNALVGFEPHILITDVFMPEMGGLQLITEVRTLAPNTRIIAISGGGQYGDEYGLAMARNLGADISLEKPLSRKALIEAIDSLANVNAIETTIHQTASSPQQATL